MKINIIEYFENSVLSNPDKIAIIDGEMQISFIDLQKKAKVLSNELARLNFLNKPIAVYLPKSIEIVTANIAITYSGNTYMNLDIKTPLVRIRNILDLINPSAIITSSKLAESLKNCELNCKLIIIDEFDYSQLFENSLISDRIDRLIDSDPLCIINTSGSTGTPKGVVLNHKSFIDFTEWALNTFDFTENEIIGSLSPVVFDIYSFELCMLMAKGSSLVLLPDSYAPFPAKILTLMQEKNVSFIFWVPTIMVNIANMELLSKIPLPELKTVWFAGEVFPTKPFNYWKRNLQKVKFVNLYGPIEITLDCTYFIVESEMQEDEPIPIGYPCRNTDILILDENDELVGQNEEGELCVRGTSLAMGYYNNPEKTVAAFVQNPLNKSYPEFIYRTGDIVYRNSNNQIIFKGRKDSLIKHMGYRIELGEIEHVIISTLNLVENGCVLYNTKNKEITLFYEDKKNISISEMRKSISEVLPKYMIPSVFIKFDELPRNTNGKIDRLFLSNKINNG